MSESVTIPVRLQTPSGPVQIEVDTTEAKVPIHSVLPGAGHISDTLVATAASLAEDAGHRITCLLYTSDAADDS